MLKPLNVWSMSDEAIGRDVSNFAHTPFVLDGLEFGSVEAFYVWLLLSSSGTEHQREKIRPLWGLHAKRLAPRRTPEWIVYRDTVISPGSVEHLAVIKRALRAKFDAHLEISREFVATAPRPIEHETGFPDRPDTEFPRATFCRMLTEVREELATNAK